RTDHRPPPQRRRLRAGQRLRLRPMGERRPRHGRFPHRRCAGNRARRAVPDIALRPAGRRNPVAAGRLAEGAARTCRHRRRGIAWPRSGRRLAGTLAARPQSFDRQSGAARLHARATCRVASPPKDRAMTRFGYVMVTYFVTMGVAVAAFIPTPTKLIWNATASAPIGFYTVEPAERI